MPFRDALIRIFRPVVRLMIDRGVMFPEVADLLKRLFVQQAEAGFGIAGKRMTDSRISLLTGLQRRDVKLHRGAPLDEPPASAGPLPRIVSRWLAEGARSMNRAEFEALVASVSRDMHPRTILDELVRQGIAALDGESLTLLKDSYLPGGDDAKLGYFGANLGDHTEAAVSNLMAEHAPFYERAVHYNRLSDESLRKLDALARTLQQDALSALNREALRLQSADAKDATANGRFRCGAYVYLENGDHSP